MLRVVMACLLLGAPLLAARKTLDIYFVDVEGGQATLLVAPSGKSLLVDTGWPGFEGRDALRIAAAARKAGVKQIDYLLITHYHRDHVGGVAQLVERLPVLHFVDHGPNTETGKAAEDLSALYEKAAAGKKRITVKPGDKIPVPGIDVTVLAARGEILGSPLAGGGQPNPLCDADQPRSADASENARSVGTLVTFGPFRFLNLGDLTWNKELELVCPVNRIGPVDVYLSTHHGMDSSGPAALVHAVRPRVAILNNGARKGGTPAAWQVIRSSPGLEDLWQLHFAIAGGRDNNVAEAFIANPDDDGAGHWLRLSVDQTGAFTVYNSRNKYQKSYPARPR